MKKLLKKKKKKSYYRPVLKPLAGLKSSMVLLCRVTELTETNSRWVFSMNFHKCPFN